MFNGCILLKHSMAAAIVPAAKTIRPELGSPLEPHASRPRDVAAHGAESLGLSGFGRIGS